MLVVCHLFQQQQQQQQQQTGVLTFDLMVSPPGSDSLPTADGATELGMVYTLYCTYPLSALPPCEKAPLGTRRGAVTQDPRLRQR